MATKKLQILDSLIKQAENADTLDGKHAEEFASAEVEQRVDELETLVGDESVSSQINTALNALSADEVGIYVQSDTPVDAEDGDIWVDMSTSSSELANHTHDDRYYTEDEIDKKLYDMSISGGYTHPKSGVVAGTYKSVTVDVEGHITDGTNPTTLDGYGITDAVTKTELDAVADLIGDTAVSEQIRSALKQTASKEHEHGIEDIPDLQRELDGKAEQEHGIHVSYSTNWPVMDGTPSAGSASTVARSDHKHPTDTSRASLTDLNSHTSNKSNPHSVTLAQLGVTASVDELSYVKGVKSSIQTQLDAKASNAVATQSSDGLLSKEDKAQLNYGGTPIVTATSANGSAYIATVDGITELKKGMRLTIIPNAKSTTSSPTLNVNNLGAKSIRIPVASRTSDTATAIMADWISYNSPINLKYDGTDWVAVDLPLIMADYICGIVSVSNGGTGATKAANARINLGVIGTEEKGAANGVAPLNASKAVSIENGGTGATTVDGAKSNLGITDLEISTQQLEGRISKVEQNTFEIITVEGSIPSGSQQHSFEILSDKFVGMDVVITNNNEMRMLPLLVHDSQGSYSGSIFATFEKGNGIGVLNIYNATGVTTYNGKPFIATLRFKQP